jgi:competence protein ComEA
MPSWTPAERRGALLVALLLSLGAARDLWRAAHPRLTPAPPATADGSIAPSAAGMTAQVGRPGPAPGEAAAVVDLNQAGLAELDALPGIGPVLAGRILQHRAAHGPFREPEDLLAVPGIGPRLFERLRPRIRVGPTSAARTGPNARPDPPAGP